MSGKEPWVKTTMKIRPVVSEEEEQLRYDVAFGKRPKEDLEAYIASKEIFSKNEV